MPRNAKAQLSLVPDTLQSDIMSALTLNYWLWLAHVPFVRHNLNVLSVCEYHYSSYIANNNRLPLFLPPRGKCSNKWCVNQ